jgi:transcription initiation factor TFIID subunit 9B
MEISKSKNKNPLPSIKFSAGIRLPPDRFCLHAPNYLLKSQAVNIIFF